MVLEMPSGFGDIPGIKSVLCIMQYFLQKIKVNFRVLDSYLLEKKKRLLSVKNLIDW